LLWLGVARRFTAWEVDDDSRVMIKQEPVDDSPEQQNSVELPEFRDHEFPPLNEDDIMKTDRPDRYGVMGMVQILCTGAFSLSLVVSTEVSLLMMQWLGGFHSEHKLVTASNTLRVQLNCKRKKKEDQKQGSRNDSARIDFDVWSQFVSNLPHKAIYIYYNDKTVSFEAAYTSIHFYTPRESYVL
jgi:hypothetical protein